MTNTTDYHRPLIYENCANNFQDALKIFDEKAGGQITPNVQEADVLDWLEAHPDSFDLITGYDIIEHFHKNEVLRFLYACNAVLKPSGVFTRVFLITGEMSG